VTLLARDGQPGSRPLADHRSLELGKAAEHLGQHAPRGRALIPIQTGDLLATPFPLARALFAVVLHTSTSRAPTGQKRRR